MEIFHKLLNTKSRLRILMNENEKIRLSCLARAYSLKFGEDIDHEKFGYTNLKDLCEDMSDVFTITKENETDDWLLSDNPFNFIEFFNNACKVEETQSVGHEPEENEAAALPHTSIDPAWLMKNYVEKGYEIKQLSSPIMGSKFKLFVTESVDPSHFWFRRCSPEHNDAFDTLMDIMNAFYRNCNAHKIFEPQIESGYYCAVLYRGIYCRAVILSNENRNLVKVRIIDYGTVSNVPKICLRFLLKEFSILPIQAFRGRLYGVKPKTVMWSQAASDRFMDFVYDIPLDALVTQSQDNDVAWLSLIDEFTGHEDFLISQRLIREGLGEFGVEHDTDENNGACQYLLPSFNDIEMGLIPNFVDLENGTEIAKEFQNKNIFSKLSVDSSCNINPNNNENLHEVNRNKNRFADEYFEKKIINNFDNIQQNLRGESDIAQKMDGLQINQQLSKPSEQYNTPLVIDIPRQNKPTNQNIPLDRKMPIPSNSVQHQNMPLQSNVVPQQYIPQAQCIPFFQYMPMQQNIPIPWCMPFQQSMLAPPFVLPHFYYSPPQQNNMMQHNVLLPIKTGLEQQTASLRILHHNFEQPTTSTNFNVGECFNENFANNNSGHVGSDSSADNVAKALNRNLLPNTKNVNGKDRSSNDSGANEKSEDSNDLIDLNGSGNTISNQFSAANTPQMRQLKKTNTLELIGIENVGECSMEIWSLKCTYEKLNSIVVIIDELFPAIFKREDSQSFVDFVKADSTLYSKIWFIEFKDNSNVDYIKLNGKSNIEVGQELEIYLMTDKYLSSRNSLAIMPLEHLESCLLPFKNILKVPFIIVLKEIESVNRKYT